jgi:hypothetical protein
VAMSSADSAVDVEGYMVPVNHPRYLVTHHAQALKAVPDNDRVIPVRTRAGTIARFEVNR